MDSENNSIDRRIENGLATFGSNFSVVYAASRSLASRLAPSLGANCLLGKTMWTTRPKGLAGLLVGHMQGPKL